MPPGASRPLGSRAVATPPDEKFDSKGGASAPKPLPSGTSSGSGSASTSASDDEAGSTSVSEAAAEEGGTEALDGEDMGAVVTAGESHVDTSVAEEAEAVGAGFKKEEGIEEDDEGDDEEDDESGAGKNADTENVHVEENCCSPEEIPQELVSEFNLGHLIIKA
jgi:hypothetical protein